MQKQENKKQRYPNYIFVALGGFVGAILRFQCSEFILFPNPHLFPINTLLINLLGSFFLALFLTFALELWRLDENIKLGIATGFFGAYTTFSTFCKELVLLIDQSAYYFAITYFFSSVLLGLLLAYGGIAIARKLMAIWTIEKRVVPVIKEKDY